MAVQEPCWKVAMCALVAGLHELEVALRAQEEPKGYELVVVDGLEVVVDELEVVVDGREVAANVRVAVEAIRSSGTEVIACDVLHYRL